MIRIGIAMPFASAARQWAEALRQLLPGSNVAIEGQEPVPTGLDYAVVWRPPAGWLGDRPGLRAVFSAGAGVDHLIDSGELPAALPLYRIEDGGMAAQMAGYCAHEVLRFNFGHARYEAQQRAGLWKEWPAALPARCTVGVFGLGVLGREVALTLARLGFEVRGYARTAHAIEGVRCFDERHGLPAFLAECRVLILLAPLTAATRDLFDAARLADLPRGAWLINVARGALVVDEALIEAIDAGHLAGASLDVFREEPLPADHPFWRHPHIRITPHVSAHTVVAESARQVAERIGRLEAGLTAGGRVDPARGY